MHGYCCHVLPNECLALLIVEALKETIRLKLVGPYSVLAGHLDITSWEDCVLESRYFYDTPEVLTVLESIPKDGYHLSYYRSDRLLYLYVEEQLQVIC